MEWCKDNDDTMVLHGADNMLDRLISLNPNLYEPAQLLDEESQNREGQESVKMLGRYQVRGNRSTHSLYVQHPGQPAYTLEPGCG